MSNPYSYDPTVDDDLFEQPQGTQNTQRYKHRFDGKICTTCHVIHSLPGIDFDEIPPADQERLLEMFDTLPDDLISRLTITNAHPGHVTILTSYFDYLCRAEVINEMGPLLRALFVVINEQTQGRLENLWRLFEFERRLIVDHRMKRSAVRVVDDYQEYIQKNNEKMSSRRRLAKQRELNSLRLIIRFMGKRMSATIEAYRQHAKMMEVDVVDEVIDSGTYPEDTNMLERMLMLKGTQYRMTQM